MGCVGMNRLIGITGAMSAGKTTIAKKIMSHHPDFIYIDIDEFRRALYQNKAYVNELKEAIPALRPYPEINSIILNKFIYHNDFYMQKYKDILYKYLNNYLNQFVNKTIIIDWALIFNDHLESIFDQIIYVEASIKTRLSRLHNSDLSESEILRRFKLQKISDWSNKDLSNVLFINNDSQPDFDKIETFLSSEPNLECKFTLPSDGMGKAIWEITHQCNYGCSYCIFSCTKNYKPLNELTTEECFHIIDELASHNFRHLKITGGEPLIRKDIIDVLRYASSKLVTDISTNASLLTEEKVRALNELKLKMIHVSLDGNRLEHESVRGKNTYDQTMKGLRLLKNSTNKVRIGAVIHSNNEYNLESLIVDSQALNADEIIFSIMEPVEGQDLSLYKTKNTEVLISELDELQEKYKGHIIVNYNFGRQNNAKVHRCPAGDKFLYISNLGNVSPCPWVHEVDKTCISDISLRDHPLEEVLKDKKLTKFLNAKGCGKCYGKIQ